MTTEILCRLAADRTPIVFVTNTIDYANGLIEAWAKGSSQFVPLSAYHATSPLSTADEEILRQRYMRAFQTTDVIVRRRLPRQERVRENVLTRASRSRLNHSEPKLSVETVPPRATDNLDAVPVAPSPAPVDILAALEQMRGETAQAIATAVANAVAELKASVATRSNTTRKAITKKAKPVTKVANRRPAAKPISKQH